MIISCLYSVLCLKRVVIKLAILFFCYIKKFLYICTMEQEELYDTIVDLRITVLELQHENQQLKDQLILNLI